MESVRVVRIGHACILINIEGKNILTDPWFSEKIGYYRKEPLGMHIKDLPHLDAVIVSHGHYDHYDMDAFKEYADKSVPFFVRKGIGAVATAAGFVNVTELDHWQEVYVGDIKIIATPAKHMIPENTYIIQHNDFTLFFGADSLFIPEFVQVAKKFPRIDLAFLPVNGLTIRPLLNKQVVMTAQEAGKLCAILKPKIAIPIHYAFTGGKLRDLFLLKYRGTAQEFVQAARNYAPQTMVKILPTGQAFEMSGG